MLKGCRSSYGRTCQIRFRKKIRQHDRVRASASPHDLVPNQMQDNVYCVCFVDATNKFVEANDSERSHETADHVQQPSGPRKCLRINGVENVQLSMDGKTVEFPRSLLDE